MVESANPASAAEARIPLIAATLTVAAMAVAFAANWLWPEFSWQTYTVHSAVEAVAAVASVLVAIILISAKEGEGRSGKYVFGLGLLGMGLLDIQHAFVAEGDGFVFLHSAAVLVGGSMFALVWVPSTGFWLARQRATPWIFGSVVLASGLASIVWPDLLPDMVESGRFTSVSIAANVIAGVLFLSAGAYLVRNPVWSDRLENSLFALVAFALGASGVVFAYSEPWGLSWWLWHAYRLAAFLVLLGLVAHGYAILSANLRLSLVDVQKHRDHLEDLVGERTAELAYSEQRFRAIFEQAAVGIALVAPDGRWIDVNSRLCEIVGYDREELLEGKFQDITHPDDLEPGMALLQETLDGVRDSYVLEKRYYTKAGAVVWVNLFASLVCSRSGEPDYFVSVVEDISEQKKTTEALELWRRNEQLNARIGDAFLKHADDKVFDEVLNLALEVMESEFGSLGYVDDAGALVVPTMTRHIWTQCEVADKSIVFPREEWGDTIWPRAMRQKETLFSNEPSTRIPEGHVPISRTVAAPIVDRGEAIGLIHVANKASDYTREDVGRLDMIARRIAPILGARLQRDRNERARDKAAEELRSTAERLRRSNDELQQFAYVASHDLQEPLRMVSSFAQLLAERYEGRLDTNADEFIGFVVEGANRMQDLIQGLLEFSRIESRGAVFEATDCNSVIEDVLTDLQMAIEETDAKVTYDRMPRLQADDRQIARVFLNLVSNALKFCGDNTPKIHISAEMQNGDWQFSVSDNGPGIDPRYHDRVFQIFQRLNRREDYEGTGMGLAICKRIVERHGGRIWVESSPGEGAEFLFTIPQGGVS